MDVNVDEPGCDCKALRIDKSTRSGVVKTIDGHHPAACDSNVQARPGSAAAVYHVATPNEYVEVHGLGCQPFP
jgi:hypothetical protein